MRIHSPGSSTKVSYQPLNEKLIGKPEIHKRVGPLDQIFQHQKCKTFDNTLIIHFLKLGYIRLGRLGYNLEFTI